VGHAGAARIEPWPTPVCSLGLSVNPVESQVRNQGKNWPLLNDLPQAAEAKYRKDLALLPGDERATGGACGMACRRTLTRLLGYLIHSMDLSPHKIPESNSEFFISIHMGVSWGSRTFFLDGR
jgi:hypothetical protein